MHVSALHLYPVKSLRGIAVESMLLDSLGPVGDRRFMIVDADGRFLTQRTEPRLALIETELTASALVLRNPAHGSAAVGLHDEGAPILATVWRDQVTATDCGVEIATWLSDFLRQPCRLVRVGRDYQRPVKPSQAQPGDVVSFADAYPLLVISEGSLNDLNDRLQEAGEEPVPMNRFRPNLVIRDCPPFAEDGWPRIRIGDVTLRSAGPCARCIVTTTDQTTGERHREPLRTLATYRRDPAEPSKINFGQNLIHETKSGTLRVGDEVTSA